MIDREIVRLVLEDMRSDGVNQPMIDLLYENFNDYTDHLSILKHMYGLYDRDREQVSRDAWTYGQIRSKHWLIKKLAELNLDLGNVWILCGWIGSLSLLLRHSNAALRFDKLRSFDVDPRCAPLADALNRPWVKDNLKFKASTIDVNQLHYDEYDIHTLRNDGTVCTIHNETANTIINTSCDHLGNDNTWWNNIPLGKLVILQNNDFLTVEEHNNNVTSQTEFKFKYPMSELYFSGVLDCKLYNRYMLIGRR